MKIELPNLRVMIHYYTSAAHLFKTVTMYPEDRSGRILDEIAASNAWFGGRFAAGHRESYMKKRRFVEARMCEQFARKYGAPRTCRPVYFYIRP